MPGKSIDGRAVPRRHVLTQENYAPPEIQELLLRANKASLAGDSGDCMTALYDALKIATKAHCGYLSTDLLYWLAREARVCSDPASSWQFATEIFDIPEIEDTAPSLFKGYLAIGHHFANAGLDSEVLSILKQAEHQCSSAHIADFSDYLSLRACAEAMQGRRVESVSQFDVSIELSEAQGRGEKLSLRLFDAAANAPTVGLIARAYDLYERATVVNGSHALGFRIAHTHLAHAWTRIIAGDLSGARRLLGLAEQCPSNHYYVRLMRTAVGVLLGTLTGDDRLVLRCTDFGALDLAFRSGSSQRIGVIAGAIHHSYVSKQADGEARELLSRALEAVTTADDCWWLLLQTARHGDEEHVKRALDLLRPYDDSFLLARAHRLLLQSRFAWLAEAAAGGREDAIQASRIFLGLGWRCHYAYALELAGRKTDAGRVFTEIGATVYNNGSRNDIRTARGATSRTIISEKEQQIALMVARGATNRRISEKLHMPERSVKYHLTILFNILGVDNRSELAELVNANPFILSTATAQSDS